ncbi:MAG: hypothetical protein ACTSXW_02235 [Candidatus Baldrarchaeia archaeon]
MCGISGVIGNDINSTLEVLKILEEYVGSKGYYQYSVSHGVDKGTARKGFGTGFMWMNKRGKISFIKANSLIEELKFSIDEEFEDVVFFIGHTRWPSKETPVGSARFTHPFKDCNGKIFVVHNGGFANYRAEYERLKFEGHRFESEYDNLIVDSELIPHLIEEELMKKEVDSKTVIAIIKHVMRKIKELSVNGKPGNFAVLISGFPYLILAQEKMTTGSRFKIWRSAKGILISTYKDIEEAREALRTRPDLNIGKLVEMNKRLDRKLAELGYDVVRVLKLGEVAFKIRGY